MQSIHLIEDDGGNQKHRCYGWPGSFFGRLKGPLKLMPAPHADAVALEGEMEVDETGRRVTVCIPLSHADAVQLWRLLDGYKRNRNLPDPGVPAGG